MASPRPAPPPPVLPDDLIEEVLLCLPPTEPAALIRAALVCKKWARLISSPRFRGRYRDFHRDGAILGLLCSVPDVGGHFVSRFLPASPSSPSLRRADLRDWRAVDARHGRVLLRRHFWEHYLGVWDPITRELRELAETPQLPRGFNAAVVCARHGACDHLECHGGPFLVVVLGFDHAGLSLWVYTSEIPRWRAPLHVAGVRDRVVDVVPPALVGNALYFAMDVSRKILKCDVVRHKETVIRQPPGPESLRHFTLLIGMEDGGLGLARLEGSKLSLWSMFYGPDRRAAWAHIRDIELGNLLPAGAHTTFSRLLAYAQGFALFYVGTEDGLYSFDLKSSILTKVCDSKGIRGVVPYITIYTPVLRAAYIGEGSADASSA